MPAPAGVPYTERKFDVGAEYEGIPNSGSVLGNGMGMLLGVHFGYVSAREIDPASGMATPEEFLPIGIENSTGTALPIVRRSGLLVALHTGLKLGLEPERLGDTAESLLVVVHAGARAYLDRGPARVRVIYDFLPFWSGESRLEHRVSGLLSTRPRDGWGYGVRAAFSYGQNRTREGGLNDQTLTIGLEVQR